MKDPYVVLGVDRNATDEEIKKAYRELARKYHPDKFATDDTAREMAEEKMKEINEAYDAIQNQRKNGKTAFGQGSGGSSEYNRIRAYINAGNISEAQKLLDEIPASARGAEWHFLMGCVCAARGWNFDAINHFDRACEMDPSNMEYRNAKNRMSGGMGGFGTGGHTTSGDVGCSGCDMCTSLLCADCLCELCGGDLIRCC